MESARRWERPLAVAVAILLTVGIVIAVVGGRSTGPSTPHLAPGYTHVAGTVTRALLSPTSLDPIPLPLDVAFGERGSAGLTISGAMVDERAQTITWSAGGALRLHGSAPLELDTAVDVEITPDGTAAPLDGAVGHLPPGTYRVEGDVAVGESGLATPVDRVDFTATAETTVRFTGSARVRLPAADQIREGPGALVLEGALETTTSEGSSRTARLELDARPYTLAIKPRSGALAIEGEIGPPPDSPPPEARK